MAISLFTSILISSEDFFFKQSTLLFQLQTGRRTARGALTSPLTSSSSSSPSTSSSSSSSSSSSNSSSSPSSSSSLSSSSPSENRPKVIHQIPCVSHKVHLLRWWGALGWSTGQMLGHTNVRENHELQSPPFLQVPEAQSL